MLDSLPTFTTSSVSRVHSLLLLIAVFASHPRSHAAIFSVPGHDVELGRLEELFKLHRVVAPDTTLWDAWLPMSILWLNTPENPSTDSIRAAYRERFLKRRMDAEGYVSTQQHEGLAHSEGWPFPLWTQSQGTGWHFSLRGMPFGPEFGVRPTETATNWTVVGGTSLKISPETGWTIRMDQPLCTITTPEIRVQGLSAPFLRLKWSTHGLGKSAVASLDWQSDGDPEAPEGRRIEIPLPDRDDAEVDLDVPLYRQPKWGLPIKRFRIRIEGAAPGSEIHVIRMFTAIDSRHNVNNAAYLQGCDDYLRWTGDLEFLRRNIQRMRVSLAWAIREFDMAEEHRVITRWPGHDGRSGHSTNAVGKKILRPGVGVGNNYWDLLPFGGEDALATIYYFDAVRRMAAIERQIDRHPEWNIPEGPFRFEAGELLELAEDLQTTGNARFWNESTGRFIGWRDSEGTPYDYGFTFVNNEAIALGFASDAHAKAIREWIDGRRTVAGDTSTGADIYHWRFGPRATTRRNVETYFWGWSDPASIPWGGQVQDGGAVLGFSYYDLMARLQVNGPDDALRRLKEITSWFGEVQRAGGYRKYYTNSYRGTLQGGGTAGGLGLDHEFFESVMVPQVLLYGFLGFRPRLDGCLIAPQLPKDWPSLTVRGIRLHDVELEVTAEPTRVRVQVKGQPKRPLRLFTPGDETSEVVIREGVIEVKSKS